MALRSQDLRFRPQANMPIRLTKKIIAHSPNVGTGAGADAATTVIPTELVAVPAVAPLPVIVWVVATCETVGVPLITPVLGFNDSPVGRAGLMV